METVGRLVVRAATDTGVATYRTMRDHVPRPDPEDVREYKETIVGLIGWIKRLCFFAFVTSVLMTTSMGTYLLFYKVVMPEHHAIKQLYFDYTCKTHSEVCETEGTCQSISEPSDTRKCTPVATMDLFMRYAQWEGFDDEVIPEPLVQQRVLKGRQAYLIEAALEMPETETNVRAGMFGVKVELKSSNGTMLASSVRSARVPHESSWVGVVRKMVCLGPLLLGAVTESRTVVIPSFRHFVESPAKPLRYITVRILSRGNAWRETPVEIVSAEVRIGKELNRFQNVLREHFYTCFAIGTLLLFIFQALLFLVASVLLEERRRQEEEAAANALPLPDENVLPSDYAGQSWEENDGNSWDDLPTQDEAEHESDRPVTPDHNNQGHDNDAEDAAPGASRDTTVSQSTSQNAGEGGEATPASER